MPEAPLRLTPRWAEHGVLVIDADGDFDAASAPLLCEPILRMAMTGHRWFVVDFARIGRFHSSGVQALTVVRERVHGRGGMLALSGGPDIRSVLGALGVDHVGVFYDTVAEAERACRADPDAAGRR
ncbi:STAS domain-containing protein [Actinomycetota bacterium Odt1-20B]